MASSDADEESARAALTGTPLGQVISRNANGKARVILGGLAEDRPTLGVNAETAARVHLLRHAEPLGLNENAVRGAAVTASHAIGGGASIVQFEQRIDGLEVFRSRATVVVDATKNLVSLGSNLNIAGSASKATKWNFRLSPEMAMNRLYNEHFGQQLPEGAVRDKGSVSGGELRGLAVASADGAPSVFQVTSKRILYPEQYGLTPAYYMEFFARAPKSNENEAFGYAVSAKDGRVLYKTSLTQYEKYKYRVWAETDQDNIPKDGPYKDFSPHPVGVPPRATPLEFDTTASRGTNVIEIDGFNKNKDPWLPDGQTETKGNNVDAYSDRTDTHKANDAGTAIVGDGFGEGDLRANTTADKTFDRTFNPTLEPGASPDQIKAAVTQIFYDVNWMHDYWYDSGFDEVSKVAQANNYGRGGADKDELHAEAQDGADFGQSNNANMSTPSDGAHPRMQMFVWSALPLNRSITTTPAKQFTDWIGAATWGPQTYDVTGTLAVANPANACTPVGDLTGKIAVVQRGACTFGQKAKLVQDKGAIGVIIINNSAGNAAPSLGADPATSPLVTIPVLGLSLEDGAKLNVAPVAVSAALHRGAEAPKHDGTIDNTVVAHEWGHYLHHRLVDCGSKSCGGMSEGWADFNALLMVVREADLPLKDKIFPLSQYAGAGLLQKSPYFGIRRAPYTTDKTKNPFTFQHVQSSATLPPNIPLAPGGVEMSEVHNVGEIWANTLFTGYVNMQTVGKAAGRDFKTIKRRMADYIVAGMKATPVEPTFLEQRDALLSAVWAMQDRRDDFLALAQGFADRGMGVGAVSPGIAPDTNQDGLEGVVESFVADKGEVVMEAKVEEVDATSCDHDGVLDAGETGQVTIKLRNIGWVELKDTTVKVTSGNSSLVFGDGGQKTVASLNPYGDVTVKIPVTIPKEATFRGLQPIQVTLSSAAAVHPTLSETIQTTVNFDDAPKTATVDDVESIGESVWTMTHGSADLKAWSRQADGLNHMWHGNDTGTSGDESLVSPELTVGDGDFTVSFKHRYVFEYNVDDPSSPVFFDGAVMELTEDNGATWKDVTTYGVDPKYLAPIVASDENPLAGRMAWVARDSFPDFATISLNFGKKLAGKTVKVRFRIGTDSGAGAGGWDIDDIAFAGITNKPFTTQGTNSGVCKAPGGPDGGPGAGDGGLQGIPARFTNTDSACSVTAVGDTTRSLSGLGLFAGLMMLLRRRRNR
ncbi:M36 family metallopeptidase [Pendulispora rubella]|uniref:M36 family metallopeptidase n=1 Tax=Pendulispora rubella TaxID=2741070 RepID=A0ABZ2LJM1_9BACT